MLYIIRHVICMKLFQVRNEKAEDFLALLREWEKLCTKYNLVGMENSFAEESESNSSDDEDGSAVSTGVPKGEFEVGKLVGICYGDPGNIGEDGLKFKVISVEIAVS